MQCVFGVGLPKTVRLASTDSGGGNEQVLGETAHGLQLCQSQTITVQVATPAAVLQGRLKLTIVSPFAISPPLILWQPDLRARHELHRQRRMFGRAASLSPSGKRGLHVLATVSTCGSASRRR